MPERERRVPTRKDWERDRRLEARIRKHLGSKDVGDDYTGPLLVPRYTRRSVSLDTEGRPTVVVVAPRVDKHGIQVSESAWGGRGGARKYNSRASAHRHIRDQVKAHMKDQSGQPLVNEGRIDRHARRIARARAKRKPRLDVVRTTSGNVYRWPASRPERVDGRPAPLERVRERRREAFGSERPPAPRNKRVTWWDGRGLRL